MNQQAKDCKAEGRFGSSASPLVYSLYDQLLLFTLMGIGSLLLELGAPVAILNKQLGRLWAINAFLMHWGILFIMGIKFRYQLAGLIFASFFNVERLVARIQPRDDARRVGEARPTQEAIVLFDGVCNFCNGTVQFILARDNKKRFKFAPLQSRTAKEFLRRFHLPTDCLETMVLVQDERCYTKSTAVLLALKQLSRLWSLLYVFILLPRPFRDFLYDEFAKRRYRWFGKREQCLVPTRDVRERFLE